jgi:hypothetical protein
LAYIRVLVPGGLYLKLMSLHASAHSDPWCPLYGSWQTSLCRCLSFLHISYSKCFQNSLHDIVLLPIANQHAQDTNTACASHSQTPSSRFPLHVAFDFSHIPLPTTPDANLHHPPTVASATGHTPADEVAGSSCKIMPSDLKGKGKCRLEVSDSDLGSGRESKPPKTKGPHSGHYAGAGNYQNADLKELLCLVKKELSIGSNGWKHVFVHFAQ